MIGLKPTYKIDFIDWLNDQNLSEYKMNSWELRSCMNHLLFDINSNDVYKSLNLDFYDDVDSLSFDFEEDEYKVAIPLVKKFFKEMKEENINEILVDVSW